MSLSLCRVVNKSMKMNPKQLYFVQLNLSLSALWNGTVSNKEPLNVGTIEISKQASLEELKTQVLALSYFTEQNVSSIHLLRLRLMENKKLTTVLKGLNNTLQ